MIEPQKYSSHLIALKKIVEGTSAYTGKKFFETLVQNLGEVLEAHGVWITEFIREKNHLRTLGFWLQGKIVDEYEYYVPGTPCESVFENKGLSHIPENIIELYPEAKIMKDLGAVSYMGIALNDIDGKVLGNLALLDNKPMPEIPESFAIFSIFASRATAELRRVRAEKLLRDQGVKLNRLINGTQELIIELDEHLKITQTNKSTQTALGYSAGQLIDLGIGELIDSKGMHQLAQGAKQLSDKGSGLGTFKFSENFLIKTSHIEGFLVEASLSRYEYDNQTYYSLFLRDLKKQEEMKRELQKINFEMNFWKEKYDAHHIDHIIGESQAIQHAKILVNQVATTNSTVMITGETGTGKELFAKAIHDRSKRKDQSFVTLNCAALPNELIESELFGHVKGAFTGALSAREGRFKLADKGTIFLDEIGELPIQLQPKLLRILQEGEFQPIGSSKTLYTDVRVIAATNRDLHQEIEKGRFREDLYYRLNVFPIHIPPLRNREGDILLLANAFLSKFAREIGLLPPELDILNQQALLNYHWPGNVRELQNIIERAIVISKEGKINLIPLLEDHPNTLSSLSPEKNVQVFTDLEIKMKEKQNITLALEKCQGQIYGEKGAARLLKIPPTTLSSKIKKMGIKTSN